MLDLAQIIPSFGNFAFMIAAFVVALSVIVAIHEYGHYIVGRWCGIHAEVFSLGFGRVLFSGVDKHGTKWQVAALPLGGYVKFLGDANAASVGSDGTVSEAEKRRTMLGAPLWARAATVAAGPIFNFILAILVFAGSAMYQGQAVTPLTFDRMHDLPPSFVSELEQGDVLVSVNGHLFDDPDRDAGVALSDILPLTQQLDYQVLRDGDLMTVTGPYLIPSTVAGVTPRSAADDAGIKKNDVIVAIDGNPIFAFDQIIEAVNASEDTELMLTLWRAGRTVEVSLSPRVADLPADGGGFEQRRLIGISGLPFFEGQTSRLGPVEAVKFGTTSLWTTLKTSVSALKHILIGEISTCNLSSPVGIAETSGSMAEQGPQSFIWFIGMLSAAVGLINLFPIPVLDGGHLVFHAYEGIARRKPSDEAVRVFMTLGLVLIGALMSFALLNDLVLCP